jgi:uncharacterized repeat protein (TIGR03943 family)
MRPERIVRGLLLLGLALLIGKLLATGQMGKYMAPGLDPLSWLTALALTAMAAVELRGARAGAQQDAPGAEPPAPHGVDESLTAALLLVVLSVGFVVTPRALGTSGLGGERITSLLLAFAPGSGASDPAITPAGTPLDGHPAVLAVLRRLGLGAVGQRVRLVGTVARSDDLGADEAALLRYAIVHCVADARPVAFVVVAPPGTELPADQWIEIEGTLAARERDGIRLVAVQARQITPIDEPDNPYLSGYD